MRLPTLPRLPALARRIIPIVVPILIVAIGAMYFVVPMIASSLSAANEVRPLEDRAALLRRQVANPGAIGDTRAAIAEFERLVSAEDKVPQVMERLAQLALEPQDFDQARALSIEAGQKVTSDASRFQSPDAPAGSLDPRWALFPVVIEYTPITVTFESTYDRLGSFLWRLRDMPTLVEVRSLEVTRALPLLKVKVVLAALRRTTQKPEQQQKVAEQTVQQPGPRVADAPPAPESLAERATKFGQGVGR